MRKLCWVCVLAASLMGSLVLMVGTSGCVRKGINKGATTLNFKVPAQLKTGRKASLLPSRKTYSSAASSSSFSPVEPQNHDDIQCFMILVRRPGSPAQCTLKDPSNPSLMEYVPFSSLYGWVAPGQSISLNVPSGPGQEILLLGSQLVNGTCPEMAWEWEAGYGQPYMYGNMSDISRPVLLGRRGMDLPPGNVTVNIAGFFNTSAPQLDDCHDSSAPDTFPSDGGYVPVADLDFRYSLPGSVSISRSGPGYYFDSWGDLVQATANQERLEYDPWTWAPLGILIEDAATNLITFSQDMTDTSWVPFSVNVAPISCSDQSPDSTLLDACLLEDSENAVGSHVLSATVAAGAGDYTFSIFIKGDTINNLAAITLEDDSGNVFPLIIDPVTGDYSIGNSNLPGTVGIATNWGVQPIGLGWYRIWISATLSPTTNIYARVYPAFANYTAMDPFDTLYDELEMGDVLVWGAQLETGLNPSSYIPTSGATATRYADVVDITTLTGFDPTIGTLDVKANFMYQDGFSASLHTLLSASDGTNYWNISYDPADLKIWIDGSAPPIFTAGPLSSTAPGGGYWQGGWNRVLLTYENLAPDYYFVVGDYGYSGWASQPLLSTSAHSFKVGRDDLDSAFLNGHIEFIRYYDYSMYPEEIEYLSIVP